MRRPAGEAGLRQSSSATRRPHSTKPNEYLVLCEGRPPGIFADLVEAYRMAAQLRAEGRVVEVAPAYWPYQLPLPL